jgi:type IV pilus assembly protein PilB
MNPTAQSASPVAIGQDPVPSVAVPQEELIKIDSQVEQIQVVAPTAPTVSTSSAPPPAIRPAQLPPRPPTSSANPDDILEILIKENYLTLEQVQEIRSEQLATGKKFEDVIADKGWVQEEFLTRAVAKFHNIPFIKISETGIDPESLNKVDESVALRYRVFPFAINKTENTLMVAMHNPLDLPAINFVSKKSGFKVIPHYATVSEIDQMISERYSQALSADVSQAIKESPQEETSQKDYSALSGDLIKEAPINRIVDTILGLAMKSRASDIHIEPQTSQTRVRYRIDGILMEKLVLPKSVNDAVVSRIKILSDLKLDEKRVPQDGRFNYRSQTSEVDLRVSTLPTIHGEKVVMRLLKKETAVPSLDDLGLTGLALSNIKESISVPHGIILVAGPTGSGKTTTLYSALHIINTPKVNIMTLEDPVEYQMPGISQVQVNPLAGLTFASGLRSFLRQDPDVIMVGEIRDSETAELAVQAALTGHLVFSTLHTSSAAGAIPRMLDMGIEPFLLSSTMTVVLAQRVVRKLSEKYKEEYKPEPAVIEGIKKVLGDKFNLWIKKSGKTEENLVLYRSSKDRPQDEPEYQGRIGIFEVMQVTEEISKLILERKPASEIEKSSLKNGMMLMKQDGYIKALEGVTTLEEVLRVAEV